MTQQEEYQRWLDCADETLQPQLKEYGADDQALRDAFFQHLAFGTGGLRGIIGAGPNRMNIHTVGQATQGLANYLNANFEKPSVAIARDSRNMGEEFCKVAAGVLAANGIVAHLYPRIEPTPALSFATRHLNASAGICMTASHNPSAYNGYKVYGPDGCQITTVAAKAISEAINAVDVFTEVKVMPYEEGVKAGLIKDIDDSVVDAFIDACVAAQPVITDSPLKLVYTPLHGAGLECVSAILKRIGVDDVTVEPDQAIPNGNFPTCPYPNPEFREALEPALALCEKVQPDLLIATDPDTDRVGIAVNNGGEFVLLTGNEVGVMLTDFVMQMQREKGADLTEKVVASTIVSSAMLDALSAEYGFEMRRTLTGFKYIGEQIGILEAEGRIDRYAFGFEESYGYLLGTHARDKDAVVTTALICEMARWYRAKGMNLAEAMEALYQKHGYYANGMVNMQYPGAAGAEKMAALMKGLRENAPAEVAGMKVLKFVDYAPGVEMPIKGGKGNAKPQMLPAANVLEFQLEGDNVLLIRPSGTEPKIKAYLFAKGQTREECSKIVEALDSAAKELLS